METAVDDALIGRLVDGRYRVRSRIARGGMATVYEASDERLGRDVALKVMHPDLAEDDEFVQRFIDEARSAAALSRDRAIVTVFDQGTSDGIVWLALELVRGRTLRQVIVERGRLDPRTALAVMDPVLAALAAAHDAGIVHRDVKPENVLVGDDGDVQVADFGLAHAVSGAAPPRGASTRGLLLGTVAYISPEQALGHPATQASDVYAAGVLLYELLTGHPPHDGATDYVVVRKHVDEDVAPPSTEIPDIPPAVDALVSQATARTVADRYPDAGAFLGAVRRTRKALERDPGTRPTGPFTAAAGAGAAAAAAGSARRRSDTNPIHRSTASIDPTSGPSAGAATVPPNPVTAAAVAADPFETPPKRRRRKRRLLRLVVTVLVLGALGGAAWWWFEGRLVETPPMVGMTVDQAQQLADAAGLSVVLGAEEYSETIPLDAVVSTEPAAGQPVAPGGSVTLVLSLGPERYDVPSIVGTTRAEAEAALADLTLVPGEVDRRFSEDVPRGQVISQDPAAGTEVKRGAEVSFVMSRGRQPIDVPDVVGDTRAAAAEEVEAAGLVARFGEAFSDDVDKGRVISQDPSEGTLFRGEAISMIVSLGPETVVVPDVEGRDADEAQAELEAAGLVVRTIVLLPAGPNNVLRQAPAEGSTVNSGSEVTIYIF
ncbi:MAG: Stk1 family PASTA domain-containing Ser/Thr kinase [Jiangellales bacterium]